MRELPIVDLALHPAYAGLAAPMQADDGAIEALIADIDQNYEKILADHDGGNDARLARFEEKIAPNLARLRTHLTGRKAIRSGFLPHVLGAFDRAADALKNDLTTRDYGAASRNSMTAEMSAEQAVRLETFRRDGFFSYAPNSRLAKRVLAATRLERAVMRRRARARPWSHCVMPLTPFSAASRAIQRAVKESGLVALASAYMGRPMEFMYAVLDHAHPGQDWHQGCYADRGVVMNNTVYMHTDAGSDVLKAMLYLNDVDLIDGPFRYIPGSHAWKRSLLSVAFQCALDKEQSHMYELTEDRLDYASHYYRPLYKTEQGRRDVLSLPRSLQGSTHFGDDIQDETDLSRDLLAAEKTFTGPAGTLVLFDGSRGIHRGSIAQGGSRWAVQLGFQIHKAEMETRPFWRRVLRPVNRLRLQLTHTMQMLIAILSTKRDA